MPRPDASHRLRSMVTTGWTTRKIAWAVAGALGLALVVLVAWSLSQGDDIDPRRVAVNDYIAEVNIAGQGLAGELIAVSRTYESIADATSKGAGAVRTLKRAEATVGKLEGRLGELDPPAEAEELHRRTLALARLQSAFARDVTRLARYLIAVRAEARSLTAATTQLSGTVGSSTDTEEQQDAFAAYALALHRAAGELATADVPEALKPIQKAEVARVEELASLSTELRDALVAGDAEAVERLLTQIGQVSRRSLGGVERRAILAYNSHQKRLIAALSAVEEERTRLTNELG